MRVFVTGLTGFLGSSVARELIADGHDIFALCRTQAASQVAQTRGATPAIGDLGSRSSLTSALEASEAEVVLHLASLGLGHAQEMVGVPSALGIRRSIFVSTTAIFTNLNAGSKAVRVAAEKGVTDSGLDWTIIRPTMIYGRPGDRNIERLLRRVGSLPILPVPGADSLQQPVHVDDLARSIVNSIGRPDSIRKSINVPGPSALTFAELIRTAAKVSGHSVRLVGVPVRPVVSALGLVERTGFNLPISAEQVQRLDEDKSFDVSEAVSYLGHKGRTFEEGVALLHSLIGSSN